MRVRMVLEEKQLAYERVEEDLDRPSAELLRIHPEGRVPVLVHQGQVISESAVITEYLEDVFPEPALRPATPAERARMRLWTVWCDSVLKPDLDRFKYEWAELAGDERAALLARLQAALARLDSALASGPCLLGQELSLADIHVFPFYRQLSRARPPLQSLLPPEAVPHRANAWLERLTSRPSFTRVMAK